VNDPETMQRVMELEDLKRELDQAFSDVETIDTTEAPATVVPLIQGAVAMLEGALTVLDREIAEVTAK
jgi:hypothetical protein